MRSKKKWPKQNVKQWRKNPDRRVTIRKDGILLDEAHAAEWDEYRHSLFWEEW